MKTAREIIQLCENEIRAGRADRVGFFISSLDLSKLARSARLPLANLCRRASLLNLGLKILGPLVRGQSRATDAETAEYAVLLQRSGSVREALTLLKEVETSRAPEALLFRAFCHFNRWEYASAIPVLQEYLSTDPKAYQALIGRVNLAAALLVSQESTAAEEVLLRNFEEARRLGAVRLEANCRELHAQLLISKRQFSRAEEELEKAARLFGSEKTLDQLFVQKWKAVVESEQTGSTQSLLEFRQVARVFGDTESIREVDLYLLKSEFDDQRFRHLYFGSPLAGYRARILRELSDREAPTSYLFGSADAARIFELGSGQIAGADLNAGKKIHQMMRVLLRDFYRPLTLGALFAELHPDEYFDINSSPTRVHQLLRRTREWLLRAKLPVSILEEGGAYRISVTGDFAFRLSAESESITNQSVVLARLREFSANSFQSSEARLALGMSATSFRRFLNWAIAEGHVKRLGASRGTSYQFCAPNLSVEGSGLSRAS